MISRLHHTTGANSMRFRRPVRSAPSFPLSLPLSPPTISSEEKDLLEECRRLKERELNGSFDVMDEMFPNLFLGGKPTREDIARYGITAILNLAEKEIPRDESFGITKYMGIPIDDHSDYPIREHFEACNKFIKEHLENGERVLVHCYVGVSRSATIMIAYLMANDFVSYRKAFDHVKDRRMKVSPNLGFILTLRNYETTLSVESRVDSDE
jgi:protein-tyrosine phosphatase